MDAEHARIIDRAGKGRPAIGTEDFERVLELNVYVDKTLLVRELIDRTYSAVLFCRPRRFGKSLTLRMLQCFFEAPVERSRVPFPDRRGLFEGTAISGCGPEYMAHCGAHPVVYLSLNHAQGGEWGEVRAKLAARIADEYLRHDYLLDSPALSKNEKAVFERLTAQEGTDADLSGSLSKLSELLARHHGAKTVILIDEYDQPAIVGHLGGFRRQAVSFMRDWLTGALKSRTSLYLGVLAGVQRISRESIFSQLNNLYVNTALDSEFDEAFGFTVVEAEELARHVGLGDKVSEMRAWYDGYCFGGTDVYNPWSVLNYLNGGGQAQPYWNNTSGNDIVRDLFMRADGGTVDRLADLADGGSVPQVLRLDTVFDELDTDPQAVWSQLYLAGYLTCDDVTLPNDSGRVRNLRVPNREVAEIYRREFLDRAVGLAGNDYARLGALHDALVGGDAPALARELVRCLDASMSYHDAIGENSYHMFLLGLLAGVPGYLMPRSNRESGNGRPDVVLEPDAAHEAKLPAHAVEVKRAADADDADLEALAADALAQARSRRYAASLRGCRARLWGLAFSGKRCAAACETA